MGDSYCLVYAMRCFPQVIDFTKGRACFGSAWRVSASQTLLVTMPLLKVLPFAEMNTETL